MTTTPPAKPAAKRNRRGTGSIEYHEDGSGRARGVKVIAGEKFRTGWEINSTVAGTKLNRITPESVAADKAAAAAIEAARIAAEVEATPSQRTLRHAINAFNSRKKMAASTLAGYQYDAERYLGELLDRDVATITRVECTEHYDSLASKGYSSSTIRHAGAVLRNGLGYAHDRGWVDSNVAWKIKMPEADTEKIKGMPNAHRLALEKAMEGHRYEARYLLAIRMASRPGELAGLRWSHVNFEEVSISIEGQLQNLKLSVDGVALGPVYTTRVKTEAGRRTYKPGPKIMGLLAEWKIVQDAEIAARASEPVSEYRLAVRAGRAARLARFKKARFVDRPADYHLIPDDLVFTQRDGEPLLPTWHSKMWRDLCTKAKIPPMRLYAARHTAITHMLSQGVPILTVSLLAGHRSVTFTQTRYGTNLAVPDGAAEIFGDN
jgi:integrase